MIEKNQFLAQVPYDLYELALFRLVVKMGSFTAAAQFAGLTQSAVTRQIQGMERALGIQLLKRTTRSVSLTTAGEFLHREAARILGDVDNSLRYLRQEFADAPKEIRVGVSRTIGLGYLPGFFHANLRKLPGVTYRVQVRDSPELMLELEADEQDVAVLCPPARLPRSVVITHRFEDVFVLIASAVLAADYALVDKKARIAWLNAQSWLAIQSTTRTGDRLQRWCARSGLRIRQNFEVDNFDLIINLVSLGMGLAFVPARALALYGQKRNIRRLPFPCTFTRELAVVTRRWRNAPAHLKDFVANILF